MFESFHPTWKTSLMAFVSVSSISIRKCSISCILLLAGVKYLLFHILIGSRGTWRGSCRAPCATCHWRRSPNVPCTVWGWPHCSSSFCLDVIGPWHCRFIHSAKNLTWFPRAICKASCTTITFYPSLGLSWHLTRWWMESILGKRCYLKCLWHLTSTVPIILGEPKGLLELVIMLWPVLHWYGIFGQWSIWGLLLLIITNSFISLRIM